MEAVVNTTPLPHSKYLPDRVYHAYHAYHGSRAASVSVRDGSLLFGVVAVVAAVTSFRVAGLGDLSPWRRASGSRPASRRSPSAFRAMDAPRAGHLAGPRTICPYQGSPPGSKSCLRPSAGPTEALKATVPGLSLSIRKETTQ
jgi:hypothetical protein